jgi:hypothetical protein
MKDENVKIRLTLSEKGNASQEKIRDVLKNMEDAQRYGGSNKASKPKKTKK